jgi:hypothetical protein
LVFSPSELQAAAENRKKLTNSADLGFTNRMWETSRREVVQLSAKRPPPCT